MEIKDLRKICISNLILIILNDKNSDILRRFAEAELRTRIQNVGWVYDDLLHIDDKVIKQRGLDIENYLISPNVNMQQLLETYFMYDWQTDYYSNYLLFSEKHLCNEDNFGAPFFSKVCNTEIKNINERLEKVETSLKNEIFSSFKQSIEDETLFAFRQLLEEREKKIRQDKQKIVKDCPIDLLCHNEAMYQLDGTWATFHEFSQNWSNEKMYKNLSSKLGTLNFSILLLLNETLFDTDLVQYLCGLKFIIKDSSKLNRQKEQLLREVRSGYKVNYETEKMQKVLQKIAKINNC